MSTKLATHSQGLFRKYFLLLVALVSGVWIPLSAINIYSLFEANKQALLHLQMKEALNAATKIEHFITEVERQIQLIMDVEPGVGSDELSTEFYRLLRQAPAITEVIYIDFSGRERVRVSRLDLDVAGTQRDLSGDPIFIYAKSRGTYFSPVYFRDESEPYMTIAMAGSSAESGVAIAHLNLKFIWEVISRMKIGKAGYAYVLDSNSTLIAHPNISMVLRYTNFTLLPQVRQAQANRTRPIQGETATVAEDLAGRQVLTAYTTVAPLGWLVFAELPVDEAYAPLYVEVKRLALLLLAGLVLAPLGGLFLARKMMVPIRALKAGAARIGSGDLGQPISIKTGDEFEALADQFNNMAGQLQQSRADLEKTVETRTRELAQSVDELRALGEVSQAINSTLDLETVLTTIVAKAVQLSGTDAGTIYTFDELRQEFRLRATHGMHEVMIAAVRDQRVRAGETAIGKAAAERAPVQIPDVLKESSLVLDVVVRAGYRAVLVVPLLRPDQVIGALVVQRKQAGEFPKSTVDLLETFAAQSVFAIQNASLFSEIEEKSQQLAIASEHKSHFLANMSHELRTPLNAILGFSELIMDGMLGEVPAKLQEAHKRIHSNGMHLLGLINDVLDLSKIEAGQLTLSLEDYSIAQVVHTVLTAVESLADEKKLALKSALPPDLPKARGDERRMVQVLLNLVGNAIKFTEAGEVVVTATAANGSFTIGVSDTGPGIPEADQIKIFEEFQQAASSSKGAKGGTGLGLSIAKRIVEMHGGRIWLDSSSGHGSTFSMTLPLIVEKQKIRA